jgi:hypothetical protein
MKLSIFLTVLFSSVFAFACPNLAGKYKCAFGDGEKILTVEQRAENNVQIYKVKFEGMIEELITDGVVREKEEAGMQVKYSSSCVDDKTIIANLESTSEGQVFLTAINVVKKPTGDAKLSYSVKESGATDPGFEETLDCKRQK